MPIGTRLTQLGTQVEEIMSVAVAQTESSALNAIVEPDQEWGDPAEQATARKFCVSLVAVAGAALLAIAAFNWIVNPYAQYQTQWFEPLVVPSRTQKVRLFRRQSPPPEALIIGSSRVMKFEPDYVCSRIGYTCFNAGVNYARPEDYLAWWRLYQRETGQSPRLLIVGIDVAAFSENAQIDPRLLAEPSLGRLVPEVAGLSGRYRRWQELLSWKQTVAAAKSLKRAIGKSSERPHESFCDDGRLIYHEREAQIQDGTYDLASAIAYNCREYRQLLHGYERLSEQRCLLFERLIRECHAQNTQVVVFLTPLHPELRATLLAETGYANRLAELRGFLTTLADQYAFRFADLSTVECFEGDAAQFVDGIHPLEANTRRMIDRLVLSIAPRSTEEFEAAEAVSAEEPHVAVQ